MKVVLYSHAFAPSVGGIEHFVMALARELVLAGREVVVVTPTERAAFDDAALPFRVVRRPGLRELARIFRSADVIQLAGPVFAPLLIALATRRPVVIEHHGCHAACPNGHLYLEADDAPCPGWFMKRRYDQCLRCNAHAGRARSARMLLGTFPRRWLTRLAAVNITPSGAVARALALPRTVVIHHGVPRGFESAPSGAPKGRKIAYVGRLVTSKGIGVLLDAAELLARRGVAFEVEVLGDGFERDALEARAKAAGLAAQVRFRGEVRHDELLGALADVSIVVMPTRAETFGLVAAEAMMMGKAIVVADLPVMHELVGDAGLFAPACDAGAFADAIEYLLERPTRVIELGSIGRKRALAMFREPEMIRQHLAAYDELAPLRPGARQREGRASPAAVDRASLTGRRSEPRGRTRGPC